jgi:hypothetical protein
VSGETKGKSTLGYQKTPPIKMANGIAARDPFCFRAIEIGGFNFGEATIRG